MACGNNSRAVSIEGGTITDNTADFGSAIYLENGELTLFGGEKSTAISGMLFKNQGTLYISDALPDFSKVALRPISNTEGTVVLTAKGNLTFTEEFVKSLTVLWSVAYLGNNNKAIMVKPNTATVTLIVNGNTVTQTVPIGGDSVFELPDTWEGIAEDKYISEWTWNGNSYPSGKAVPIDGNRTFTAVIGNKFTVTLKYADDDIETHYVKPNERFYLPVDSHNEQYKIIGWNVGDTMYLPAAGFDVKGNTEVVADLMKLFKVVINDKDIESVSWQEYSYSFVLEEPEAPEGKKFAYWNVNGVRYEAGQTISITSDTVIKAVFNGVLSGGIIALIVIIIFLALNGAVATAVLVLRRKKQLAAAGATTGGATTAGGSTKSTTKSKSTGTLEKSAAKTTATKSTAATATAKPAAKPATTATAKPAAKPTTTTAAKPTAKTATTATPKPA
ncbi:MAG: hypothetical protein K2N47_01475, partial [Clostridia bacterium]|nr:hypothetical protein [Clostridia bacterium]